MQKNKMSVIDYLKFVLCILIIILHTGGGGYFSNFFIQTVCRLAVPAYLVISGFFFCNKLDDAKKIKEYIFRIFRLYLVYSLIYVPFSLKLQCYTLGGRSILYALIHGTFIQLWYFPALILATLVIVLLYRIFKNLYIVLGIGVIFYIWGTLAYIYQAVPSIYELSPSTISFMDNSPNNFLYFGMIYVTLGMILYKKKEISTYNHNSFFIYLGLAAGIVGWVLEAKYLLLVKGANPTICFGLVPVVVFGFLILSNIKFSRNGSEMFRNASTIVFGIHYVFYFVYVWFIEPLVTDSLDGKLSFFFVLAMSIMSSFIILILSKKVKILKILY